MLNGVGRAERECGNDQLVWEGRGWYEERGGAGMKR